MFAVPNLKHLNRSRRVFYRVRQPCASSFLRDTDFKGCCVFLRQNRRALLIHLACKLSCNVDIVLGILYQNLFHISRDIPAKLREKRKRTRHGRDLESNSPSRFSRMIKFEDVSACFRIRQRLVQVRILFCNTHYKHFTDTLYLFCSRHRTRGEPFLRHA